MGIKTHKKILLEHLVLNPENFNYHSPEQIQDLTKSLETEGLISPLSVRLVPGTEPRQYLILCGEGRYRAAQELGWKDVDCYVYSNLRTEKERELMVADNLSPSNDWISQCRGLALLHFKNGQSLKSLENTYKRRKGQALACVLIGNLPTEILQQVRKTEIKTKGGRSIRWNFEDLSYMVTKLHFEDLQPAIEVIEQLVHEVKDGKIDLLVDFRPYVDALREELLLQHQQEMIVAEVQDRTTALLAEKESKLHANATSQGLQVTSLNTKILSLEEKMMQLVQEKATLQSGYESSISKARLDLEQEHLQELEKLRLDHGQGVQFLKQRMEELQAKLAAKEGELKQLEDEREQLLSEEMERISASKRAELEALYKDQLSSDAKVRQQQIEEEVFAAVEKTRSEASERYEGEKKQLTETIDRLKADFADQDRALSRVSEEKERWHKQYRNLQKLLDQKEADIQAYQDSALRSLEGKDAAYEDLQHEMSALLEQQQRMESSQEEITRAEVEAKMVSLRQELESEYTKKLAEQNRFYEDQLRAREQKLVATIEKGANRLSQIIHDLTGWLLLFSTDYKEHLNEDQRRKLSSELHYVIQQCGVALDSLGEVIDMSPPPRNRKVEPKGIGRGT